MTNNLQPTTHNPVVRIPPSPTGLMHIGTARTALFNFLFAKKYNGRILLRIEDTDKERSKKEYEENIMEGLRWLGITHDEFSRQSERGEIYKKYLRKMIEDGCAYVSKEEPKEEGQRSEVIRFKNPNKKISFEDAVRGQVEVDTTDLGDFVIAKSEDEPLYHLGVVVDDHEMGVTHVIRGEDHISNTPRQILILEAIGAQRPIYAHIPLILAPDRSKLSKRHGATAVTDYREMGYLPEAMINYLALLGWNPGTDKEIFTLDELVEAFDLDRIQKGGAIFDEKKLRWVNKEHMKMHREKIEKEIKNKLMEKFPGNEMHPKLMETIFERIEVLSDLETLIEAGELDYFFTEPVLDKEKISWKGGSKEETINHLNKANEIIKSGGDLMTYAEEAGKGNVLWPVRYSLSGREKSPDPFTLTEILGKEESVRRLNKAVEILNE